MILMTPYFLPSISMLFRYANGFFHCSSVGRNVGASGIPLICILGAGSAALKGRPRRSTVFKSRRSAFRALSGMIVRGIPPFACFVGFTVMLLPCMPPEAPGRAAPAAGTATIAGRQLLTQYGQ